MPRNNLLYVEDNERWREILQISFAKTCKSVEVTENYDSALRMIQEKHYDLIISDGLEGDCFRLYEAIKYLPHGHFVIFSGYAEHKQQAKESNIPFYNKPEDLDKLLLFVNL